MRLSEDKIRQAILHPERRIRDAAVAYFADSFRSDPELMPLVIQAVDQYGWERGFQGRDFVRRLAQTETTLRWLIDRLRERGQPRDEEEFDFTLWLLDGLVHTDASLLKLHQEEILALEAVDEIAGGAIEERIDFLSLDPEDLWNELEEFREERRFDDELEEDADFADRLVEALGRHPGIHEDQILEILSQEEQADSEESAQWLDHFIVRLAGELRLAKAVPMVLEQLNRDDHAFYRDCIHFFVKIGTDELIDTLADGYAQATWDLRLAAAEVFGRVHSDRSVERSLALASAEEELETRCLLVQAALRNFAEEAIGPARQLLLENELDPGLVDVRYYLVTAATLLGADFPELGPWKEAIEHDSEFLEQWYAEHGPPDEDDDFGDYEPGYEDMDDYEDEDLPPPPPATIVREEPRIGRNDPCPCGSGKKYKKCCLKKEAGEEWLN